MHILLTDLLCCPRCGPEFGLILRGDRIEDRRVHAGVLGCPNCREEYPVEDGFADLRSPPRRPLPPVMDVPAPIDDEDEVLRIAALLGVKEGPGNLVLVGPAARAAQAVAGMLERIEVVTVAPDLRVWEEAQSVSRIATGPGLPFFSRRIRGVLLDGEAGAPYLDDAFRVLGPGGRLVVRGVGAFGDPSPASGDGVRSRMEDEGLEVVLDDPSGVVVGQR